MAKEKPKPIPSHIPEELRNLPKGTRFILESANSLDAHRQYGYSNVRMFNDLSLLVGHVEDLGLQMYRITALPVNTKSFTFRSLMTMVVDEVPS